MSIIRKHKFLGSSQNPNKLALRIQTILVGLIPLFSILSGLAGHDIGPEAWHNLIEILVDIITYGTALYVGVGHVWGWVRAYIR